MPSKTLVLQVEMDGLTEEAVHQYAKETAKWEQRVFGKWYADFRAHRGDLTKSAYVGLLGSKLIRAKALGRKGGRAKYRINVQGKAPNLYSLLLTKGKRVEPAVPTRIPSALLLGSLSHLGTTMENFLDLELRRHRSHERRVLNRQKEARARKHGKVRKDWDPNNFYPHFKPIARFQHQSVRWTEEGFTVTHPFEKKQRLSIRLKWSDDPRYADRLIPLALHLAGGAAVGVELKHHSDGEMAEGWYAHIAVPVPETETKDSIDVVMGVDVGERNPATFVVIDGPKAENNLVGTPKLYSGISIRNRLERQTNRVRRLRSMADLGSPGTREALKQAKGKQGRILSTLAHQVSHDIVKEAVSRKVDAIAMEDLTKFTPGEKVRRKNMPFVGKRAKKLRRLLSRWNRGKVQEAIRYKAQAEGINIAGPQGAGIYAKGTSSTCPRCGTYDQEARDRKKHEYRCRQPGCGYIENDDVVGASNIAARGWGYFHSPKGQKKAHVLPAGFDSGTANHPQEPGLASTGGGSVGSSGLMEGESSMPQATTGGLAGPPSQLPEKAENGMGSAVVPKGANRLSPTVGGSRGIDGSTTSQSDKGSVKPKDAASAKEVTPSPVGARKPNYRRESRQKGATDALLSQPERVGARK